MTSNERFQPALNFTKSVWNRREVFSEVYNQLGIYAIILLSVPEVAETYLKFIQQNDSTGVATVILKQIISDSEQLSRLSYEVSMIMAVYYYAKLPRLSQLARQAAPYFFRKFILPKTPSKS